MLHPLCFLFTNPFLSVIIILKRGVRMRKNKYSDLVMEYDIPYSENVSALAAPLKIAQRTAENRICIIAPYGVDSKENGEFSMYSHRRYGRFAGEGAGIIITEPITVLDIARKSEGQLCLTEQTLSNFRREVEFVKNLSFRENNINPVIILRVDMSDATEHALSEICLLADKAGFDGICVNISTLENLTPHSPEVILRKKLIFAVDLLGIENLNSALKCLTEVSGELSEFIVVTDLMLDKNNFKFLRERISQISALERRISGAYVLMSGLSEFGEDGGNIAAGMIEEKVCDLCGFSKQAVAYPSFARDLLSGGLEKSKCCILCGKCDEMRKNGVMSGCAEFDSEIFLPCYKKTQV
jgi:hypothetical protein